MSENELTADEVAAMMTGEVSAQPGPMPAVFHGNGPSDSHEATQRPGEMRQEADSWDAKLQASYGQLMTSFASAVAKQLQAPLRTEVTLDLQSIREAIYGELIIRMDNPTCVQLLSADPLSADFVLELHPTVLFPVFDRLLGGGTLPTLVVRRPLTEIETRLAGRVTRLVATELTQAWDSIMTLHVAGTRLAGNPRMLRSENPNAPMIVTEFLFSMPNCEGPIKLAIRKSALLEIAEQLRTAETS